jgi:ArsR family transcriptional regulator
MIDIFKALSDETRIRILGLVFDQELCVCEIEAALGLTQSNASRHLTALKNAGLLSGRKSAQWMYYRLSEEFVNNNSQLIEYLKEKLRTLPEHDEDRRRAASCRDADLCQPKNDKEMRDGKGE